MYIEIRICKILVFKVQNANAMLKYSKQYDN